MRKNVSKKIVAISAALIMVILFIPMFTVSADTYSSGVFDLCSKLTDADKAKLETQADETSKKISMNVAIVITDDIGFKTAMAYADDFYDEKYNINTDGVLLLINLDTGYDWISTSGTGLNYYSDARIDTMFDRMEGYMKTYDCYNEARVFMEQLVKYYNEGIPKGHYIYDSETGEILETFDNGYNFYMLLGGSGAGIIAAAIACVIIVSKYKLHAKTPATTYVGKDDAVFTAKDDRFMREYTTKTKIESSSSGGGRSGGGSGSHHSSSGGSHGGGGRGR